MKFSESWLRSRVNPPQNSAALAHALTMAGLEVEAREAVAPPFTGVVVGQVLAAEKHPQADRLKLLSVDVGQGAPLSIVCGAGNVVVGMKAPCAVVGAQLPGGLEIKAAKVRGVESFGMMCSEKELGLATESAGLLVLASDATPGVNIRQWLNLDDQLFTLKLTPNRADCLSVAGVAREVAAITASPLQPLVIEPAKVSFNTTRVVSVENSVACPRYLGRSLKLSNAKAPTPDWMAQRLLRSGLRPRNALVDVTNYVLLELGQPLHAFDEDRLQGAIRVRQALAKEPLQLLNEQSITLDERALVIADDSGAIALAGVMGGLSTAVNDETQNVFLESAFFAPAAIAGRARAYTLSSDSAHRFERGVDFNGTGQALERATALLLDICGGTAGSIVEVRGTLPARDAVLVRPERVRRVLGIELTDARMAELLTCLELTLKPVANGFEIIPPSHRFDLAIEADFIEEIARLHGYDNIPATPPVAPLSLLPVSESRRSEFDMARVMVNRDYQEVITYSFVDAMGEKTLSAQPSDVVLLNPISSELSVMRSTLAVGLINTLLFNLSRKQERVRIFELGRCFYREGQGYGQRKMLGGLISGSRHAEQWGETSVPADYFDMKADVEALFPESSAQFSAASHPALHPGRSAQITIADKRVGWLGELHPALVAQYGFSQAPQLFEVDLEPLLQCTVPRYQETSRFQPIRRDLAVVVDEELPVAQLLSALKEARVPSVSELALFDLYRGANLPQGKKSVAFRVVIEDTAKTLNDFEIETTIHALLTILKTRFNAELR
jgi:phenylalanyl-tRNA synthetase beta chain